MKKNIRDLLVDELYDIFSAEEQLVQALPKMAIAAQSADLKEAFQDHLKETKGQVRRLQQIFKIMGVEKGRKTCQAMKGLVQEGNEAIRNFDKSAVRDAALISKAQRIEHYEISAYGTVRAFAEELSLDDVASLLKETQTEEANADKKLSKIAEGTLLSTGINRVATRQQEERRHAPRQKSKSFLNTIMGANEDKKPRKQKENTGFFESFLGTEKPKKKTAKKTTTAKKSTISKRKSPIQTKAHKPTTKTQATKKTTATKNTTNKNTQNQEKKRPSIAHKMGSARKSPKRSSLRG